MEFTTEEPKVIPASGAEPRPASKARPRASKPAPAESGASGHLLGADGRELPASPASGLAQLSAPLLGFTERNPKGAALLSLGVGLVAGAILGIAIKRD